MKRRSEKPRWGRKLSAAAYLGRQRPRALLSALQYQRFGAIAITKFLATL
ncbi:MAG: hypothetical protein LH647_16730 [Leptolyngbyaceae cyanobacterium CAN_BIN12]|nr:hypothetical protein [Leptolyngbyaceae cyanobacterium CAN_BIN12]